MRPYSTYCNHEVEGIGELPSHWFVKRLKYVATTNDDALSDQDDPLRPVSYVDISSVDSTRGITQIEELVFEDAPSRARRLVRDGDTIVSTVRTYLRAIAPIADPPPTMVVSTGFAVIRPRNLDPGFSAWALRGQGFVQEVVARSVGVSYPAINAPEIGNIPIAVPPLDEQRDIAAFLDRETERIDSLIAKKRLLIERLQEYRTALITRTVTRGLPPEAARAAGLDPSPRLKPSGVEWLGDVPEHWSLTQLRRIAHLKAGYGLTSDDIESEGQFPVFGGNGIRGFTDTYTHEGEFVLIGRQGALCGNVHMARDKFWASEHAVVAEPAKGVNVPWLRFVLDAMNLRQYSAAAAQPGLAVDKINGLSVPVPPDREQRAISEFLGRANARIDALAGRVNAAIERLQEYRSALITAAVTGKIDVRGEVSVTADLAE